MYGYVRMLQDLHVPSKCRNVHKTIGDKRTEKIVFCSAIIGSLVKLRDAVLWLCKGNGRP